MAHLGALTALQAARIPVDVVAGTSAGSIMGAMIAAGWPLAELGAMARQMRWSRVARPVWPRHGLVTFAPLEQWLAELLAEAHFADLPLPYAAVAVDLQTGEEVVLDRGPVAPAVRASCSVPGFVTPVRLGGRLLGDGSFVNTLPVRVARQLGADYVIGVDIFVPGFHRRFLGPLRYGLAAIEILVDQAGGGVFEADCLIRPNLAGATYLRFSQAEDLFRRGAQAAAACVPAIRRALGLPKPA